MNQATKSEMQANDIHETDWESIFESPDNGFIALVNQANSIKSVRQCTSVIIQKLFSRKNDEIFLNAYLTALDEFLPSNESDDVDISYSKERIVVLLRDIKAHRQRKAAEHMAEKGSADKQPASVSKSAPEATEKRKIDAPPQALTGLSSENSETVADDKPKDEPTDDADGLMNIFGDVFCNAMNERLNALSVGINQNRKNGDKLPFILSKAFSVHFETIIREHLISIILSSSKGLKKTVLSQPENSRKDFLVNYMKSRNGRQVLWEKWQEAWAKGTQQSALPAKPKGRQKKGLLGALSLKKDKKKPAWAREKTPEEWEAAVKSITTENKAAATVWAKISTDSNDWSPPEETDNTLLMNMFARSTNGLHKQMSGLLQIVQQAESVGRLLTTFCAGKNIDLALLSVCYQKPNLFTGKKAVLKDMMMSYTQKEIDEQFPLVSRYLSKHF